MKIGLRVVQLTAIGALYVYNVHIYLYNDDNVNLFSVGDGPGGSWWDSIGRTVDGTCVGPL